MLKNNPNNLKTNTKTSNPLPPKENSSNFRSTSKFVSRKPRSSNEDFDQIILEIKRVTRVTGGGKKLSFRAAILLGNHRDKIGFGIAKGSDVPQAIEKAKKEAMKNIITIPIKNDTIPFAVSGKYCASKVLLKPAKAGKGIIAGGVLRDIIKMTNIKNITTKILGGSHNVVNNTRAFLLAISKLNTVQNKENKINNEKGDTQNKNNFKENDNIEQYADKQSEVTI